MDGATIDGVRVGRVSYGRGVFATRPFRRRETVATIRGRVIDDPDYSSEICIDLGGSLSLEPYAPFCFLNHSCAPNCELYAINPPRRTGPRPRPRVVLETLRPIEPGEQLTIDYAWPAEGAIPCACGSPQCRGWIVADEELAEIISAEAGWRPLGAEMLFAKRVARSLFPADRQTCAPAPTAIPTPPAAPPPRSGPWPCG
jgi:uncharacterized protein